MRAKTLGARLSEAAEYHRQKQLERVKDLSALRQWSAEDLAGLLSKLEALPDCGPLISLDPATWCVPDSIPGWDSGQKLLAQLARALRRADDLLSRIVEQNPAALAALVESSYDERVLEAGGELYALGETAYRASRIRKGKGGRRRQAHLLTHPLAARVCADWYAARVGPPEEDGPPFVRERGALVQNTGFGELLAGMMKIAYQMDNAGCQSAWERAQDLGALLDGAALWA